jgi:hypothetical protein
MPVGKHVVLLASCQVSKQDGKTTEKTDVMQAGISADL